MKTPRNLSQDNRWSIRDSNRAFFECIHSTVVCILLLPVPLGMLSFLCSVSFVLDTCPTTYEFIINV
jgi:hypothetical protein